jgi:hypothetical protein
MKESNGSANGLKTQGIRPTPGLFPAIREQQLSGLKIMFNRWDVSFNGGMFWSFNP